MKRSGFELDFSSSSSDDFRSGRVFDKVHDCIHQYPGCTEKNTIYCEVCSDRFCANCDVQYHMDPESDRQHHVRVPLAYGQGIPFTSVQDCGVCQGTRKGEHSCDELSRIAPGLQKYRRVISPTDGEMDEKQEPTARVYKRPCGVRMLKQQRLKRRTASEPPPTRASTWKPSLLTKLKKQRTGSLPRSKDETPPTRMAKRPQPEWRKFAPPQPLLGFQRVDEQDEVSSEASSTGASGGSSGNVAESYML